MKNAGKKVQIRVLPHRFNRLDDWCSCEEHSFAIKALSDIFRLRREQTKNFSRVRRKRPPIFRRVSRIYVISRQMLCWRNSATPEGSPHLFWPVAIRIALNCSVILASTCCIQVAQPLLLPLRQDSEIICVGYPHYIMLLGSERDVNRPVF